MAGVLLLLCGAGDPAAAQNLALLRQPRNAAIGPPAGQGLDLIYSAEPLGKGRLRLLVLNRSHRVVLPGRGDGSAYTGHYGLAYGMGPALDLSLVLPFYLDSVVLDEGGSINKYGNGDLTLGIKWSRPDRMRAGLYTGYQLLIGLPLAYKGTHKLDQEVGKLPPPSPRRISFSSEAIDIGLQLLADVNFRRVSIYLNGGYFRSGNPQILPQLVYGAGVEIGRSNRWASFNLEYQSRVAFSQESRASGLLKFGTKINIFRGVELELNREYGLLDYPTDAVFTFGLRTHGYLRGKRRLEGRYALYRPPPPPKRLYQPAQVLRIAFVDFEGFEDYQAGRRLVEKIERKLEPHDSLEVVDLRKYSDVPHQGFLDPGEAVELARKLDLDVVVCGRISDFDIDRFSGIQLPYLVSFPEDKIEVALRYRVLEVFGPDRGQVQSFLDQVSGESRLRRRMRFLPADRRDITSNSSAPELYQLQDQALEMLAGRMLASMAEQFSWVPPDFLP